MKYSLVTILLFGFVWSPSLYARPLKNCVRSNGEVVTKRRCKAKKGETTLNVNNLVQSISATQGEKGEKGDTGATGSQGPQGVQGPQGIQGIPGLTDVTIELKQQSKSVNSGSYTTLDSDICPDSKTLIGGGCVGGNLEMDLSASYPALGGANSYFWRCTWRNNSANLLVPFLSSYSICAYTSN